MIRPSWDAYFLGIAFAVSVRSDCERAQVGALIVSPDRRIRSSGYNGSPPGKPGCISCPRRLSEVLPNSDYNSGAGRCVALHAEANAIIYANREDLPGSTLYVTRAPCPDCSKLISGAGIARVFTPEGEDIP